MKGSPISPRPAAKAAHPHPAGAEAIRLRRDAVQSLPSDLLAGLLRKAITKRQSGVGRTIHLLSADYIVNTQVDFILIMDNNPLKLKGGNNIDWIKNK